jgi:hypothetical protein
VLLLITGSADGTSDLIVKGLDKNVFRFNYDLYKDYTLIFTPDFWEIKNPVNLTISSNTVTSAFWWKAFNFYIENEDVFIVEEVKYIFREIYHWCRLRNLTKGVPHDFHNHMGKMNILNIASKHYRIPLTLATFKLGGIKIMDEKEIVAKSFSSTLTSAKKSLMTSAVKASSLHPDYPWYLQEKIDSKADITIFVCGVNRYAYTRDRKNLKGLDWRLEQAFDIDTKEWFKFDLNEKQISALINFCNDLNVDWGRIDLMERNGDFVFLEYNANGQWVFLDYSGEDHLVKDVCAYLMPS